MFRYISKRCGKTLIDGALKKNGESLTVPDLAYGGRHNDKDWYLWQTCLCGGSIRQELLSLIRTTTVPKESSFVVLPVIDDI